MSVAQPWPTNTSVLVGNFPKYTPMGGRRVIPWHKRGNASAATTKSSSQARPTALVGRPISLASMVFPRLAATTSRSPQGPAFWYKRRWSWCPLQILSLANTKMLLSILSLVETFHCERQEACNSRNYYNLWWVGTCHYQHTRSLDTSWSCAWSRGLFAAFFYSFNVTISLTLMGGQTTTWKGFMSWIHWIDTVMTKSKSLLLTIIDVTNGRGIRVCVIKALFEHLKGMGLKVLPKLLNVMSNNSFDATTTVKHMFQLINVVVRYK